MSIFQALQPLPIIAITVSSFALGVTLKNYRRKSGIHIKGNYSTMSSIDCDDKYLTNIVLENLKDRAITIFGIYLKIGHNYYVEIENREELPLILKPYETYYKEYGPIQYYVFNMRRFNINAILGDDNVDKHIYLSTSAGKYKVPSLINRWDPTIGHFYNHATAVLKPSRLEFKGESIGSNIRYVIHLKLQDGKEQVIQIHPEDYRIKKFKNAILKKEDLETKITLEKFVKNSIETGAIIKCESFEIHDVKDWKQRRLDMLHGETIVAAPLNIFQYYIEARFFTILSHWRLKRQNAKIRKISN